MWPPQVRRIFYHILIVWIVQSVVLRTKLHTAWFKFSSGQRLRVSFHSGLAVVFTKSPVWWLERLKRPGREADCSPLSSAEIKTVWYHTCVPLTSSWHGTFIDHRRNSIFTCVSTRKLSYLYQTMVNSPLSLLVHSIVVLCFNMQS
jgi:hypothetical protein